jgi:hypothetical protein
MTSNNCRHYLTMNVKRIYQCKTRCCCFAYSKIDLGRLEGLSEPSIVLTVVTWGIHKKKKSSNAYSLCK